MQSVNIKLNGTKYALGEILPDDYFRFRVRDDAGATVAIGKNNFRGEIDFEEFELNDEGEYTFRITEETPQHPDDWSIDPAEFRVKVIVSEHEDENNDKQLVAEVQYLDGYPTFKDYYKTTDPDKGLVEFPCIKFTEEGTFTFKIREVLTPKPGWELDDSEFTVTIIVVDDGKGNLVPKVIYEGGKFPEFVNTYKPKSVCVPLSAVKKAIGAPLHKGDFEFVVVDEQGNIVAQASNDAPK